MKKFIAIVLSLITLISLTACGNDRTTSDSSNNGTSVESKILNFFGESDYTEVYSVVILGRHANMPEIQLDSSTVREALYNTSYTHGFVAFICCDGDPYVAYSTDIPEPEVEGLSKKKQQQIANDYTDQLLDEIKNIKAKTEEIDLHKALLIAGGIFEGAGADVSKELIILDSGLSTTGYVDFTKPLMNADPEDIVAEIASAKALPELTGVRTTWIYQNQTAFPQEELSERQKKALRGVWETIMKEGGVSEIIYCSDTSSEEAMEVRPHVSSVEAEDREIIVSEAPVEEALPVAEEELIQEYIFDEASVRFKGDLAVFVDEKQAKETLQTVAEDLKAHPNNHAYVVGTTASGTSRDFCLKLSQDRAQAVVDVLIELGISGDRLHAIGLGFEDYWHIDDLDANGYQIEEKACQNRKTLIFDVNSDMADRLNSN